MIDDWIQLIVFFAKTNLNLCWNPRLSLFLKYKINYASIPMAWKNSTTFSQIYNAIVLYKIDCRQPQVDSPQSSQSLSISQWEKRRHTQSVEVSERLCKSITSICSGFLHIKGSGRQCENVKHNQLIHEKWYEYFCVKWILLIYVRFKNNVP